MPVLKQYGSIQLCGDYKLTVNRVAKLGTYPLPKIDDLLATLVGGSFFTKLDLSQMYQQVQLDPESQQFVTINTMKGLYCYTRLLFGVNSALSIFQWVMENLLQGLKHVCVYIDNVLVTGSTEAEHIANVEEVLKRLQTAGMKLKKEKCMFLVPEVKYLGHKISNRGIEPTEEKVRAVTKAPVPWNISELKGFIGLVNYYGRFLPNLATVLSPLYSL